MKKSSLALALATAALALTPLASNAIGFDPYNVYNGEGIVLFKKNAELNIPTMQFRIPAITAGNGFLIAASDLRYPGGYDLAMATSLSKTKLGTRISYDGGKTWSEIRIHDAVNTGPENDFMKFATDPALHFDQASDTLFMFGLRTNNNVAGGQVVGPHGMPNNEMVNVPTTFHSDFIMYTSKDQGQTWETRTITKEILDVINQGQGTKQYQHVFQGPGGGMSYKGKVYIPIQAFATKAHLQATPDKYISTSGFMVTADGGKTWEVSKMLLPNVDAKLANPDQMINSTSESNIFYHKGKIRLAVKNEEMNGGLYAGKGRLCFEYTQDEQTGEWNWVKVEEDFLPDNIAATQSSSHSLTEDVYLVAYSVAKSWRDDPTLATNTGVKLQLASGGTLGYTSIASDDNNIYVLYEGAESNDYSLMFKSIDIKHRDYAALSTQIRNRAFMLNDIQDTFSSEKHYMLADYGSDDSAVEIVGGNGGIKGGVFIRSNKDLDEGRYAVSQYDTFDVTFLAGYEHELFSRGKGTVMLGYMNSAIDYENGTESDVNSFVGGYRFDYNGSMIGWRSGINFIISDNEMQRNRNEGLGKRADFDSQSISLSNELYKGFELNEFGQMELAAGMVNTFFKLDSFREVGGEGTDEFGRRGANNASFGKNDMQSHEVYLKAAWDSAPIALSDFASLTFNGDLKYAIDLADTDDWMLEYHTFSIDRKYGDIGELGSGRDGGLLTASLGADIKILNQINIGIKTGADSTGEFKGNLEAKISL